MTHNATTFSADLAPPSGYHYPPSQHLYSGVGGYQPTATPSQLQQGMAPLYSHLVGFKPIGHFPDLALHHDSYLKANSIFISDHLSRHEPCSNCWRTE